MRADAMTATAVIRQEGGATLQGTTHSVPWWSFTKTVLATAILRLAEQGLLRITDQVDGQRFTLRQLLRHQAGLPDYGAVARYHEEVAAAKPPWPVAELLAAAGADRLLFDPGTDWAYSNIGYLKLAQIIERVTGSPLRTALAALVFTPCGLSTARLAVCPADLDGVQMGAIAAYHPGWVYHGLVVGSVEDAARLLHSLIAGTLLKPATRTAMLDGYPLPRHRRAEHPDPAYGLGVMLSATDPLHQPIGHSGAGPGSQIAVYTKGQRTAAVWTALPAAMTAEARAHALLG